MSSIARDKLDIKIFSHCLVDVRPEEDRRPARRLADDGIGTVEGSMMMPTNGGYRPLATTTRHPVSPRDYLSERGIGLEK